MLAAFTFPLVLLQDASPRSRPLRVYFEDDMVAAGLSLGDAVSEELGLDVPSGSCIIVLGEGGEAGLSGSFALAAEILHAVVIRAQTGHEISLYDWALRSLTASWGEELCTDFPTLERLCVEVLNHMAGLPRQAPQAAYEGYLALMEPEFQRQEPVADLAQRLTVSAGLAAWQHQLLACYRGAPGIQHAVA